MDVLQKLLSEAFMIPSFFQKPFGAVTLLTAAVGGPYAAYETDLGTSFRRTLMSATMPSDKSNQAGAENPNASDPVSLSGMMGTYSGTSNGRPQHGQPNWSESMQMPSTTQSPAVANGQVVSQVYGPATIVAISPGQGMPNGTNTLYAQNGNPNYNGVPSGYIAPPIEQRSGPANAVAGGTAQLWDYTLGTPTLTQIQQQPSTSIGGGTVPDLREVLRFDISPAWLPQRFSRVTTVTADVQMDGLRVPLITGTRPNDIAGSLTYFFDASQSLKRIQLHGMTGDPSHLAHLMVNFYQLKQEQSLGGQLFTSRWNNRITSMMQIAPAPVIYAGADHSKYIVFLELNQPSNQYGLSHEATDILKNAQSSLRWQ